MAVPESFERKKKEYHDMCKSFEAFLIADKWKRERIIQDDMDNLRIMISDLRKATERTKNEREAISKKLLKINMELDVKKKE